MSCFSNLSVKKTEFQTDRSFPSPEELLLDRIEDLEDRLEEVRARYPDGGESLRLLDEDLRHVLPQQLKSTIDLNRAILIAESDLWKCFGINWGIYAVPVGQAQEAPEQIEIPGQMTIEDYLTETEKVA